MVPKIIHLCWFSDDSYPVEIKVCLDSWKRVLPDYKIRIWKYKDAKAIGIPFINEALEARRWAFAADVVRVYAVYTEGGVYMDSDIFLYKRFDEFIPQGDDAFATFNDKTRPDEGENGNGSFGLNGAFFIGTKGNSFCKDMLEYYKARHYKKEDGTFDNTVSPHVMREVAYKYGYVMEDKEQLLGPVSVYPTHFLAPCKKYKVDKDTFGMHCVYGSWRKRKFGRQIEIKSKHAWHVIKYFLFKR
ncbi:MAG: capsular polysaccharide synthesis protein [Prevotellaceae bacterium]|nr:capsular polysaccharide synthesis protein [Prevotellaceae bacterium]